jgi:hypothetical protein
MGVRKSLLKVLFGRMQGKATPPDPVHIEGTTKGEELARREGREPGREETRGGPYRTARDSTGIDAGTKGPIHPDMPNIPPM